MINKILFLSYFLFTSASFASVPMPKDLQKTVSKILEMGFHGYHQSALAVAEASRADEKSLEGRVVFGALAFRQHLALKQWNEADHLLLEMLRESDLQVDNGFLVYGAGESLTFRMNLLMQNGQPAEALALAKQALFLRPDWWREPTAERAPFWSVFGDARYALGNFPSAIEAWELAEKAWDSKKEFVKSMDPERYGKFRGLDRFNPLNLKIQALLFGSYYRVDRDADAASILAGWREQAEIIKEAHPEEPLALKIFRVTLARVVHEAETKLNMPILMPLIASIRGENECEAALLPNKS